MHDAVELVSVQDQVTFTIGRGVNHLAGQDDTAKIHIDELFQKFVVIAGNVNHLRLLAALAQQFLNEEIVVILPMPFGTQSPAVDKIANQIEIAAVALTQKIEQGVHLRMFGAEMDVGNPNRTKPFLLGVKRFSVRDHRVVLTIPPSLLCQAASI